MFKINLFRLDRLLTLYLFYPLLLIRRKGKQRKITILMYHSISESILDGIQPYYQTVTSPKIFAEQMRFLYENNFAVIDLQDALDYLTSEKLKSRRVAVLTFDDGFFDFYKEAFPVLRKYNFRATVFLPTQYISDSRRRFNRKTYLCWEDVRELNSQGVRFGSHTVKHKQLSLLTKAEIEYELRESKMTIENKIGASVDSISFPYGFPDSQKEFKIYLKSATKFHGYRNGVTTRIGIVKNRDNCFFLKRIPVNLHDDLSFFRAKLDGGYNWLYSVQYLKKKMQCDKV